MANSLDPLVLAASLGFDLHDTQPGDPAMDLATLAVHEPGLLPEVLAGYAVTPAEEAVLAELVPFCRFVRTLSAAEWQQRWGDAGLVAPTLATVDATRL